MNITSERCEIGEKEKALFSACKHKMKKKILNVIAVASAVALAMVPATVNAANSTLQTGSVGNNDCLVSIENYEGYRPNVMIPKTIAMGNQKECDFTLFGYCYVSDFDKIEGSITVSTESSFELTNKADDKSKATATVTFNPVTFTKADLTKDGEVNSQDGQKTSIKKSENATGHIAAAITDGSWEGTLVFTVSK